LAVAHSAPTLLIGVLLFALGVGVTNPLLASIASDCAGSERQGVVLGIAQSSGGLARAVGPVWTGLLYARLGAAAPFWSGVCAAGVSLAIGFRLRRND
jgi:MFS family permease